jgi:hypothetical protein
MTPAEQREAVLGFCLSFARAAQTGDPLVVTATQTAIELQLSRLIPDKPTLADVLAQTTAPQ